MAAVDTGLASQRRRDTPPLDRGFITPFDREDIHALATKLDDVLDNMEETAHRLVVFRIERPTPAAVAMAQIMHECCKHLEQVIHLLRGRRPPCS